MRIFKHTLEELKFMLHSCTCSIFLIYFGNIIENNRKWCLNNEKPKERKENKL
jgi:hypothetical protein